MLTVKHILTLVLKSRFLLPPVVIGHDVGVPILVEPTLAKLLLLLLLFPHHPAAWQYTSLKSIQAKFQWNYVKCRDPAGPDLCSRRPFGSLDFVLRADIPKKYPRYPPDSPQISPRNPPGIPKISSRYLKVSRRYPLRYLHIKDPYLQSNQLSVNWREAFINVFKFWNWQGLLPKGWGLPIQV